MYTLIDWFFTINSWFLIIFLPIYFDQGIYCFIGIAIYLLYPIPMEIIYNCLASITYNESVAIRHH